MNGNPWLVVARAKERLAVSGEQVTLDRATIKALVQLAKASPRYIQSAIRKRQLEAQGNPPAIGRKTP